MAPVKLIFFYGSNNPDSVIFENAAFGEIKDHSLSGIDFVKIFNHELFRNYIHSF